MSQHLSDDARLELYRIYLNNQKDELKTQVATISENILNLNDEKEKINNSIKNIDTKINFLNAEIINAQNNWLKDTKKSLNDDKSLFNIANIACDGLLKVSDYCQKRQEILEEIQNFIKNK